MANCPICGKGKLYKVNEKHIIFGVDLGTYPGEKCQSCGEVFTDSEIMKKIESIAKKKGVWGLGVKTKVARTGNSLAIRIPQKIAKFLRLKEGEETFIHPEKDKLIVEPIG